MEAKFVEEQPMAGREVAVSAGMVVGRTGSDIELADPEVSRRHATFRDRGLGHRDRGPRLQQRHLRERAAAWTASWRSRTATPCASATRSGASAAAAVRGETRAAAVAAPPGAAAIPTARPTGIRQAIGQEPVYGEALPAFDPSRAPSPVLGAGAARRVEAVAYSYTVVLATAVAVVIYFIQR